MHFQHFPTRRLALYISTYERFGDSRFPDVVLVAELDKVPVLAVVLGAGVQVQEVTEHTHSGAGVAQLKGFKVIFKAQPKVIILKV